MNPQHGLTAFELTDNERQRALELWVMKNGKPNMLAMIHYSLLRDIRLAYQFKEEIWWLLSVTPDIAPLEVT
jgi:hypothetical protein